jgi:acyl carrier protein
MEFESFLENFKNQLLDEDDAENLSENTRFRDLASWDSLTGMAIIVMIEDEYGVKIEDNVFRSFQTIGEIHKFIESKL